MSSCFSNPGGVKFKEGCLWLKILQLHIFDGFLSLTSTPKKSNMEMSIIRDLNQEVCFAFSHEDCKIPPPGPNWLIDGSHRRLTLLRDDDHFRNDPQLVPGLLVNLGE